MAVKLVYLTEPVIKLLRERGYSDAAIVRALAHECKYDVDRDLLLSPAEYNPFLRHTEAFYWCRQCARVYPVLDWIVNCWFCPTAECRGRGYNDSSLGLGNDVWGWSRLVRDYGCPALPQDGAYYPLHRDMDT